MGINLATGTGIDHRIFGASAKNFGAALNETSFARNHFKTGRNWHEHQAAKLTKVSLEMTGQNDNTNVTLTSRP